jgi:hypothetical protein
MSDQDDHDYRMSKVKSLAGTKPQVEALLRAKKASAKSRSKNEMQDPIAAAIANNPGLTREKALEIAEKFGF